MRNKRLELRVSEQEKTLIDQLRGKLSQTDIIIIAIQNFADLPEDEQNRAIGNFLKANPSKKK